VAGKKIVARWLDSDVEHKVWFWQRYGLKPGWHLQKSVPIGIILPLVFTAFSLGVLKLMTILTYNTKAMKRRAARRFGYYSFTEMTDWHNALIGAGGIIAIFILTFISYWISGLESLARISAFYAFWNMIPIGKLDGIQIYLGSRILWYFLAIITLIFTGYALFLV
jgi:Zn-dependent protease